MIEVGQLLQDVARYLSDYDSTAPEHQHVTWSEADLRSYLQLALSSLASVRKEDFSRRIEIPLTGEGLVGLPSECDELLAVVGRRRPDGTIDTSVRTKRDVRAIDRPVCKARSSGEPLIEVDISQAGAREVEVDPPVQGGSLLVRCVVTEQLTEGSVLQLPAARRAVIFNWMVSYAFGTETESVGLRARSDEHWRRGADLLQLSAVQRRVARSTPA